MNKVAIFFLLLISLSLRAQVINFDVKSKESFRGLSVLNDNVVWLSGTNGTYLNTYDGGKSWKLDSIKEARRLDFRDVEIVNDSTVYLLTAGSPALLYKTTNKGGNWALLFKDDRPEIFMDGMSFWNDSVGVMYGDPIMEEFSCYNIISNKAAFVTGLPKPLLGEAGFAASGTGIAALNDSLVWVATGGAKVARVLFSGNRGVLWSAYETPLVSGEGQGVFSMIFWSKNEGVIVGGSYLDSTNIEKNCAFTLDGGKTWELVEKNQPNGYRSCVTANSDGSLLVSCGRTGIDYSLDKGKTWKAFSKEGYYSVALEDSFAWFSGREGKVARVELKHFK
jgi:photosystem II stability/assembly factor-like uncharacterized protein